MKKPRKFRSLTITLTIAFLALSAVVLLIANGLQIYSNLHTQHQTIATQQQLIAQEAANTVKSFIQGKYDVLKTAAGLGNLIDSSQQEQKLILEKSLGCEPAFRQLVLFNAQEQELLRDSRLSNLLSGQMKKQIELDSNELFSQTRQKKIYIGSVYIDEITSEPMVIMAVPVIDVFGDFKGTLAAEVNLKFMWDLVGSIKVGNKGLAYVVDQRGNLIAYGDISRVLRGENLGYLREVGEFLNGEDKAVGEISKGIQRNYVSSSWVALGTPDWAVMVELPVLEAYETVITTFVISGLIMLLSFALAIIFGIFLSKRIAKPIISLRDAAVRIGEGRLDTQIEIKKEDEIGDLAAAFNQMTENLRKTTTSMDNLNQEITERKNAEEQLRRAKEKYRIQFEGALDAIFVADAETGILIDCNPAATTLVGWEKSELIGKPHRILHPPEMVQGEFSKTFRQHLKEKQGQTIETQIITKAGEIKDVAIKASLLEIGGKKVLQGIFRDITENKKTEQHQTHLLRQLEKTNQELRSLVYILSHDLKAPLRGISTLTNWISTDYADKLDDNGKEQINLLMKRANRMHSLIDGILQYSRIGRVKEEKVTVNLNELVTEVIDLIAPPENITITIENELPTIECEQPHITQVFQNLLSNAMKYMDKPQGQIKVGCVEENDFWKFYVTDNGPGIEEKYFEKIFQLFQTLTPRDEFESTGIGLTVIKKIVELYNGKVWVESEPGQGSTFFFTLQKREVGTKDAKLEASIIN